MIEIRNEYSEEELSKLSEEDKTILLEALKRVKVYFILKDRPHLRCLLHNNIMGLVAGDLEEGVWTCQRCYDQGKDHVNYYYVHVENGLFEISGTYNTGDLNPFKFGMDYGCYPNRSKNGFWKRDK